MPAGPPGPAGMRGAAVAFVEPLVKLLRWGGVLGSAPPEERGTGQAMPKSHKPSETKGGPAKKAAPAKEAGSAAPVRAAKAAGGAAKTAGPPKGAKPQATPKGVVDAAPAKKPATGKASGASAKTSGASAKEATSAVAAPGSAAATDGGPGQAGSGATKAAEPAKAAPPKATTASHPKKSPPARVADQSPAEDDQPSDAFLVEQRALLYEERSGYVRQADELKAEADSLALEHEPGDVQFDEEGGEGGTSNVDRELDLVLSAQARSAIMEIDRALLKIDAGTYGTCEQCGRPIPQARLKALPYAALCVACKSGGLSRR
jgi:RNA polymerase-binding transcription factor DksA